MVLGLQGGSMACRFYLCTLIPPENPDRKKKRRREKQFIFYLFSNWKCSAVVEFFFLLVFMVGVEFCVCVCVCIVPEEVLLSTINQRFEPPWRRPSKAPREKMKRIITYFHPRPAVSYLWFFSPFFFSFFLFFSILCSFFLSTTTKTIEESAQKSSTATPFSTSYSSFLFFFFENHLKEKKYKKKIKSIFLLNRLPLFEYN